MTENLYNTKNGAEDYKKYLDSAYGSSEKKVTMAYIKQCLPEKGEINILDVGCGEGWMIQKLKPLFPKISGCDLSTKLISQAQKNNPGSKFSICDFNNPLPFADESFDFLICNMALHYSPDLQKTFFNFQKILKKGGNIVATIPNPYYAYPVGLWKRTFIGKFFRFLPKLILTRYFGQNQKYKWQNYDAYFHKFADYVNMAAKNNLYISDFTDCFSFQNDKTFNLDYQLSKFPIIMGITYTKK